jgi:proteic killer suppression protein
MIQSFRHKGLKLFYETGSKAGIVADHAKRLRVLLARLDAASKPEDMNLPGARLHPLGGEWRGYWAVNVSGNWRLIFRFEGAEAHDVDYRDYH